MSKIISGVVFNALGPILKLLKQSCEIRYFDHWEDGVPENHGFHEKIDFLEIDPQCHRNIPKCLERFVKKS